VIAVVHTPLTHGLKRRGEEQRREQRREKGEKRERRGRRKGE